MGNLYRLNSFFEKEISFFPNFSSLSKIEIDRANLFEYLFLFISNSEDITIFNSNPDSKILNYWNNLNIEIGKTLFIENHFTIPKIPIPKIDFASFIEWGQTSKIKNNFIQKDIQIIENSKFLNSKINQTKWKTKYNSTILNTGLCLNYDEIIENAKKLNFPIVLKKEFSFSGSGNFIQNTYDDLVLNKIRIEKLFQQNKNGLILEEWKAKFKTNDFSLVCEIRNKQIQKLITTKMIIDSNGKYLGSMNIDSEIFNENILTEILEKNHIYPGNFSIDGFEIQENQKEFFLMSEVNFRFTMGRILFEIQKKMNHENKKVLILILNIQKLELLEQKVNDFKNSIIYLTPKEISNFRIVYIYNNLESILELI